jgi:hypothetical protein
MADETFRTAYIAFLREWGVAQGKTAEEFEEMVDQLVSQGGPVTQMLRSFHANHGRYPKFEELFPPGGPVVGMLSDMK